VDTIKAKVFVLFEGSLPDSLGLPRLAVLANSTYSAAQTLGVDIRSHKCWGCVVQFPTIKKTQVVKSGDRHCLIEIPLIVPEIPIVNVNEESKT